MMLADLMRTVCSASVRFVLDKRTRKLRRKHGESTEKTRRKHERKHEGNHEGKHEGKHEEGTKKAQDSQGCASSGTKENCLKKSEHFCIFAA
jgi:hypothetical protein